MLEENSFQFWKDNSIKLTKRNEHRKDLYDLYIYIYVSVCVWNICKFFFCQLVYTDISIHIISKIWQRGF